MREITCSYRDPLEVVWVAVADRLGMTLARSPEVFASWDGQGTLTISTPDGFDPDDSLAQMVLHEICHALVAGPEGWDRADWGMDNVTDRDLVQEHACHRLQAALAGAWGLRDLFAVTTDHRPYWDALPADPLADDGDPAVPLARAVWARATEGPWAEELRRALQATAAIAAAVRPFAPGGSLWARAEGGAGSSGDDGAAVACGGGDRSAVGAPTR